MFIRPVVYFLFLFLLFSTRVAQAENRPFKVGLILPMTGIAADYGVAITNSIELAKKDRPELFQGIEFLTEDAQYDAKLAVTVFQKLRNENKIDLAYTFGVSFCKVLAPIAESFKTPLVSQCIDPNSAKDRHYVLRFMNYIDEFLQKQTEYLQGKGLGRIAMVLTETAYLEEMYEALKRNLMPGQEITVIARHAQDDMDLRSTISRIKKGNFDTVGVFVNAGQIAQFYRQAQEQKLHLPTFGTNFFETLSVVRAGKGAMDGAVFASNEVKPEYEKRYNSIYGQVNTLGFGSLAYEFAIFLGETVQKLRARGELKSEQLLQAFSEISNRPGVAAGPYSFRNSAQVGRYVYFPVVMKEVRGEGYAVLH